MPSFPGAPLPIIMGEVRRLGRSALSKAIPKKASTRGVRDPFINCGGEMLQAFGMYAAFVGLAMVVWFIHVGFLVKKILKEQQETNRALRQLCNAGAGLAASPKTS
jgi:hypothetical protein